MEGGLWRPKLPDPDHLPSVLLSHNECTFEKTKSTPPPPPPSRVIAIRGHPHAVKFDDIGDVEVCDLIMTKNPKIVAFRGDNNNYFCCMENEVHCVAAGKILELHVHYTI